MQMSECSESIIACARMRDISSINTTSKRKSAPAPP